MSYALTNGLIYVCFAIIFGGSILALIPNVLKVEVTLSRKTLVMAGALVPVLAVVPVLILTGNVNKYQDYGVVSSFLFVVQEIETGRAWTVLLVFSILYIIIMAFVKNRVAVYTAGLFLAVGMVLTQSIVGHAANMASYPGALSHTVHMAAVSCWAGILLVVSWFSKNDDNWQAFIDWFTFIAIGCIFMLSFTGLFMSFTLTDGIVQSWVMPYGQALLIKHLFFLILLLFAFINGFLIRKKVKQSYTFSPRKWWKAESVIVLAVFGLTGFMSETEPPHNAVQTMSNEDSSILFRTFASVDAGNDIYLSPDLMSVFFFLISFLFIVLTILLFSNRNSAGGALLMSVLAVFSLYIGLMSSLESDEVNTAENVYSVLVHALKIVA
ncbi:copper resistance D family protein [Halobacillus sp. A5]|uniref:copper resistance D family protein n=1 Tax=Halobacillus sp. A5 TaxID=2880263 RepID=UPI0020A6A696|nr:CopD family protein [Halobacillus sp. A5]MCP3028130.1 CopD family protein [Halobacillus sp. A5]